MDAGRSQSKARQWVAGLDGGGTGTDLLCMDARGREVAARAFGPLNINSAAQAHITETLGAVVGCMASLPGGLAACAGLCVAAAGLSNPQAQPMLEAALRKAAYLGPLLFLGDQEAALMGAVGSEGVVLVSGTGSICFGRNSKGQTARSGGYGHLVDDAGSGYAIGRDMVSALLRAQDGRGPQTLLSGWVLKQLGLADIGELIRFIYQPQRDKKELAALSALLTPALAQGDAAARQIANKAIGELFLLCRPVIEKLGLQAGVLAFSGGVLRHHATIADGLRARLQEQYPELKVIEAQNSAAHGAALLAKQAFLAG